MKRYFSEIILLILVLMLVGCKTTNSTGSGSSQDTQELQTNLNNVDIYAEIGTQIANYGESNSLAVLDGFEDEALIAINDNLSPDSPGFREVGLSATTTNLILFNLKNNLIDDQIQLPGHVYCSDGVMIGGAIYYCLLDCSMEQDGVDPFTIYKASVSQKNHGSPIKLANGKCSCFDLYPQLEKLGKNMVAYSYYNPVSGAFGVNTIKDDVVAHPFHMIENKNNGDAAISTDLSCNGDKFLIYIAKDFQGTFVVGTDEGTEHLFALDGGEKIYNDCLLDNAILLSVEKTSKNGDVFRGLEVKDYEGNDLAISDEEISLYRLVSGGNTAIGNDPDCNIYLVQYKNKKINLNLVDTSNYMISNEIPYSLVNIDSENYLLQFDSIKKLLQLNIR